MTDVSTTKSIFALTVVVGCFAVLWPKIFFPMMQAAFRMASDSTTSIENNVAHQKPPHAHPGVGESVRKPENLERKPGRPPIPRHPGQVYSPPSQASQGGIMGLIMPVYTIGVILFFFYTLFKVMSRKPDKSPKFKNFNMDPEHRKFVFSEEYDGDVNLRKRNVKPTETTIPETQEENDSSDPQEDELLKLRKRLADTEATMAKILKQMGDASQKLSATVPSELKEPLIGKNSRKDKEKKSKQDRCGSENNASNDKGRENVKEAQNISVQEPAEASEESKESPDVDSYEIFEEKDKKSEDESSSLEEGEEVSSLNSSHGHSPMASEGMQFDEWNNSESCNAQALESTSSFEYISSNDNTPLSPDKEMNLDKMVQGMKIRYDKQISNDDVFVEEIDKKIDEE